MAKFTAPRTLAECMRHLADPQAANDFMVTLRWPNGVECPRCGSKLVSYLANARVWKCRTKHPSQKFSVKVGTIIYDSPIGLDKWLPAMWLITNAKNGISSYELHRGLRHAKDRVVHAPPHSAGDAGRRRRAARRLGLDRRSRRDVNRRRGALHAQGRASEEDQRHGRHGEGCRHGLAGAPRREGAQYVRTVVLQTRRKAELGAPVRANVEAGSEVFTDELPSCNDLADDYVHDVINHAEEYARGIVHTNGIENFWSLLKRGLRGLYVSVEPLHLFRYLDEQAFRFNERKDPDGDGGRFQAVCNQVAAKRLTYKELIGEEVRRGA